MTIDQLGEEYLLKGMEAVSVMGPRKILTDTDMNKAVGAAFSALVGGEDEALKEVGISPELAKDIREAIVAEAKPKEPKRDIVTPEQYLTMAGWKIIYEMKDGRLMVELE
jgi:hypothetical protein